MMSMRQQSDLVGTYAFELETVIVFTKRLCTFTLRYSIYGEKFPSFMRVIWKFPTSFITKKLKIRVRLIFGNEREISNFMPLSRILKQTKGMNTKLSSLSFGTCRRTRESSPLLHALSRNFETKLSEQFLSQSPSWNAKNLQKSNLRFNSNNYREYSVLTMLK